MKKNVSRVIAAVAVMVMILTMFTACGNTISGKYKNDLLGLSFEFKSSGKVYFTYPKLELSSLSKKDVTAEGTYEINEGKITMSFADEGAKEYSGELSFEKGEDFIKISGVKFSK